jgi:hypothetical protein
LSLGRSRFSTCPRRNLRLFEKTEEISNKAADKVLDELVDKVMEEGDEGQ